ncbi:MAG: iron transporter [Candidatus Aegiribacteria sp. MLS_C]|nr:MAG: iron transporter [Candidatus Aegiribacteria sp. MLS_C]
MILAGCGGEEVPETATSADSTVTVVDGLGRTVTVPFDPEHVICSGPGCLRLLVYLQAQDRAVAVDDMEGRRATFEARPYFLANPQLAELPVFGEFRGHDNPELIIALDPRPQVIFKTFPLMGTDPLELEEKTGIPVVVLEYGSVWPDREDFGRSLRIMGEVLDRGERAEEVIAFIDSTISDLAERTSGIPDDLRRSCFVGGIAYRGPHGFQSTEPGYPPFILAGARNVSMPEDPGTLTGEHADVAKEQILAWDPEVIFVDGSTLEADPGASALHQLRTDPAYSSLSAVRTGEVYCLLPYNWYTWNLGSILADAYFIGKVLYPESFEDVDPAEKADEIYRFLVGAEVFLQLKGSFEGMVFERVEL